MNEFRRHVLNFLDKHNGSQNVSYREADNAIIDTLDRVFVPRLKALEAKVHALETRKDSE